jgi:hypothetical protein
MSENTQPVGENDKPTIELPEPLEKHDKLIMAGTAAMAVSFFLPWIDVWIGAIGPTKLLDFGSGGLTFGVVVFLASFALAAFVCLQTFFGKTNHKVVITTGILPFLIAIVAIIKVKSATSDLPFSTVGEIFEVATYGMTAYFFGAAVTLVNGLIKSDELTAEDGEAQVAATPTDEPS